MFGFTLIHFMAYTIGKLNVNGVKKTNKETWFYSVPPGNAQ